MARFYELQRKEWGVLLTPEGGPLVGRSFDADNRKKLPKGTSFLRTDLHSLRRSRHHPGPTGNGGSATDRCEQELLVPN